MRIATASTCILGLALAAGCSDNPADAAGGTALLSVTPADGAIDVAVATTVTLTFSHPMGVGTEMYAAVCEGDGMMGTRLAGTWRWSADRTVLTFHPAAPLAAHADHTVHVGGGLLDGDGRVIDLEAHQHAHDGQWVTPQMVSQRMMSGMMMDMTGPGWRHDNGTYGMYFTFATGS